MLKKLIKLTKLSKDNKELSEDLLERTEDITNSDDEFLFI